MIESVDIERLASDKAFRNALLERTVRESVSRQIRELREWKGWTQAELGMRLNTTASCIARLENPRSKSAPRISTLLAIAAVFDVALMIRFVSWDKFLIIMGESVIWVDSETEIRRLQEWADEQSEVFTNVTG